MSSPRGYRQTLDFLYSRLPMYQRIGGAAFNKGLVKTLRLLEGDNDPQLGYPKIHIAGTNGKGTVSHMLAACYQAAGKKVGLYTSPHYRDFRERIKVDGQPVSKSLVVNYVRKHMSVIETLQPSFFEITVAMAFHAFRAAKVDIAVIETGLGGRLDSTNVIVPILSVITNIGYDHMDMLGETLPDIAAEKAGIIKAEVPVVIGERQPETSAVFEEKASQTGSPLSYASDHVHCSITEQDNAHVEYAVRGSGKLLPERVVMRYGGPFQARNLATALWSVECAGAPINATAIAKGLREMTALTNYFGRWQVLSEQPYTLCDSAHNRDGLLPAVRHFESTAGGRRHFVLGFVKGKDLDDLLSAFPKDGKYYFSRPDIPRGLDAEIVREAASQRGLRGNVYTSVRKALSAARLSARPDDSIFVGGSNFVVAEVI